MIPKYRQYGLDNSVPNDSRVRSFVILEHDSPFLHWDYLIDDGGTLACWRLMERPGKGVTTLASRIGNHRRHYLTYEGPVSGGRGEVRRVFAGQLHLDESWPLSDRWYGLTFSIVDSDLSAFCVLLRAGNTDMWKFS
jgi:hypothetical protein